MLDTEERLIDFYMMNVVEWQQICMIGFWYPEIGQVIYRNFFWFGLN